MRPDYVESIIIDNPDEVEKFLNQNKFPIDAVLAIRNAAYGQMIDCSPLMASNAPGSLAYHYGVLELRIQLLGLDWEICRAGGIESVTSPDKSMKVTYQNVDIACSKITDPKPRSEKGPGAERDFKCNMFEFFGVALPRAVKVLKAADAVFSVMVDDRGAVEVSRPVVENGKFTGFIVRVFVSDGSDLSDMEIMPTGSLPEPIDDFKVVIENR